MGARMTRGTFFLLVLFIAGTQMQAQVWDTIPPPTGGTVYDHVRSGQLHYCVIGEGESWDTQRSTPHIFCSVDDGASWTPMTLPTGSDAFRHSLLLDGTDRLFYLNEQKLYRTTDAGVTWMLMRTATNASSSLTELQVDASGRLYLLVMSEGVFTSTDHGTSWSICSTPSNRQLIIPTRIACIGNDLFLWWANVAETADTLFRSSDHGQSWTPFLTGMVPREVIDGGGGRLLVSRAPVSNGVTPFQILATRDGGMQWDTLHLGSTINASYDLRIVERRFLRIGIDTLLYFMDDSTSSRIILFSSDGGQSWSRLRDRSIEYCTSLSVDAANRLLVYGRWNGLLRYSGILTDMRQIGFIPLPVNRPPLPTNGNGMYACSEETFGASTLYHQSAGSVVWSMFAGPGVRLANSRVRMSTTVFFSPPDTVYTVIGNLARTTDLGRNWSTLLPSGSITHGNTSERRGRWILSGYDSMYVSENGGREWTAIPQPPSAMPFEPGPTAEVEGTLLQGDFRNQKLWRKAAADSAWISRPLPMRTEELISGTGNMLYARGWNSGGLLRTSNLGDSWETPHPAYGKAHALLMVGPDTLIALDTTRGLAISPDRGNSWTLRDLRDANPRAISLHDGVLYIGTQRLGILHTSVASLLSAFSSLYPENQTFCMPRDIEFRWTAEGLSEPFHFRCGSDSGFAAGTLYIDTTVNASSVFVRNLLPGTDYFWEVAHERSGGAIVRSTRSHFAVAALPLVDIVSPQSNAECINPIGEISWTWWRPCVESSDMEISLDDAFQTLESSIHVDGPETHAPYTLAFGTSYHVRVRSTAPSGAGPWSPVISFRTIDDTVAAPLQSEPANGSTFTAIPPSSIKWEAVDCVSRSEIVTSRTQDFSADTVTHAFRQNPYNYFPITGVQRLNGTYYWKVRAWRDSVPGQWSPVWSFTLDIPVNVEATPTAEVFRILPIYPQPAGAGSRRVTVECDVPASTSTTLIVCDMLGRERLRVPITDAPQNRQSIPIDVSALPSGQYLIVLQGGLQRESAPLLIVR